MPTPPDINPANTPGQRPQLTCDWQVWAAYLEASDATDAEKRRFIEMLWGIAMDFVDLGWDLGAPRETSGQDLNLASVLRAAVVHSKEINAEQQPSNDLAIGLNNKERL